MEDDKIFKVIFYTICYDRQSTHKCLVKQSEDFSIIKDTSCTKLITQFNIIAVKCCLKKA